MVLVTTTYFLGVIAYGKVTSKIGYTIHLVRADPYIVYKEHF